MARTERDRDRLRVERELREAERVLPHLRGIRPRVLRQVTDLESWAETGRAGSASGAPEVRIPTQWTTSPGDDDAGGGGGTSRS